MGFDLTNLVVDETDVPKAEKSAPKRDESLDGLVAILVANKGKDEGAARRLTIPESEDAEKESKRIVRVLRAAGNVQGVTIRTDVTGHSITAWAVDQQKRPRKDAAETPAETAAETAAEPVAEKAAEKPAPKAAK